MRIGIDVGGTHTDAVLMDGAEIGDFKEEGKKKIDLVVKTSKSDITTPEELFHAPLVTPQGRLAILVRMGILPVLRVWRPGPKASTALPL